MPLTTCPDCKGELSTAAPSCPHCGRPATPARKGPACAPTRRRKTLRVKGFKNNVIAGTAMLVVLFGLAGSCAELTSSKPAPEAKPKTQAEIEEEKMISGLVAKFGPMPLASAWDGSYLEVERHLKGTLRDPDSLSIDACTKVDHTEEGWLVGCDYRARNGFGGMNRESDWFLIRGGRVIASLNDSDPGT